MPTQKIIEIKSNDWPKGISAQPNLPVGGLFQRLTGCDPFEQTGVALPSLTPASITPSPSSTPKVLTNWNNAGTSYVYVHSDTKLLRVLKDSPYTQTDITASITVDTIKNAILWQGKYIYATTQLRSLTFAGVDTQILAGYNGALDYIPLCIGADKNLYVGDDSRIHTITSSTGTAGNSVYAQIDPN